MKYFFTFLFIIAMYIYYLSQTEIITMLLFEQQETYKELKKPIIYKDILKIEDINGTYKFNCKTKWLTTYKDYEVGIAMKYKFLTTNMHRTNPTPWKQTYIKANITIKDKNNKIIQSKTKNSYGGYGWGSYHQFMVLDRFSVNECKDISLKVDFIDSTIKNVPTDLMYFYIIVDERL
jgi:hypothetical protein